MKRGPPKFEANETPIAVAKNNPKSGTSPKIYGQQLATSVMCFDITGGVCCCGLGYASLSYSCRARWHETYARNRADVHPRSALPHRRAKLALSSSLSNSDWQHAAREPPTTHRRACNRRPCLRYACTRQVGTPRRGRTNARSFREPLVYPIVRGST